MTQSSQLPWIGLVGNAGAGKDTVANELVRQYGYTRVAFADPVRAALLALDPMVVDEQGNVRLSTIVETLGWENAKRLYPEVRYLLQRLGTDAIRTQTPDYWLNLAYRAAQLVEGPVVFTDTRFTNEIEMVDECGGVIVHVNRNNNPVLSGTAASHASENDWRSWQHTTLLQNNGNMLDLYEAVDTLIDNI